MNLRMDQNDLIVEGKGKSWRAHVRGWHRRHAVAPRIKEEIIRSCCNGAHQLLFRGDKEVPLEQHLFILGLKSRPLYSADESIWSSLPFSLNEAPEEAEARFLELATAFSETHMLKNDANANPEAMLYEWRLRDTRSRLRLTQLILYGIHYQATRLDQAGTHDELLRHLFVRSSTTSDQIAVQYALSRRHGEPAPERAVVFEYAPPCGGHLYEKMTDIIDEFESLGLGRFFPDRDEEVLIPFGMLPHYMLGYSELRLLPDGHEDGTSVYTVRYKANPHIAHGDYTLESPKRLTQQQRKLIKKMNDRVALVFHAWEGDAGSWYRIIDSSGKTRDISGTEPT